MDDAIGPPSEIEVEDEMPKRGGISPLTMVWVALLLAGYLYRACAG
jgi:hypothetical protein